MPIQINIRNVREEVRDELRARAASRGQSMQEYLLEELEHIAFWPTPEMVMEQARQREAASQGEG